jgi:hypothetical protein
MSEFKYVNLYRDRQGKLRCYFRRRGRPAVPLPTRLGTFEFRRAYEAALATSPAEMRRKAVAQKRQAETRRIQEERPTIGVYLLLFNNEIIYVGSSTNMANRVKAHRANGRVFDQMFFISTRMDERKALEELLILKLRPRGNTRMPD